MLRFKTSLIIIALALTTAMLASGCAIQPVMPETSTPTATEESTQEAVTLPADEPSPFSAEILANLTYSLEVVPTGPVQLVDGVYEDTTNRIFVNWSDTYALGTLNGEPAAAVVLSANTGGSGQFRMLAVVTEQAGEPTNLTSTLLGDRVTMNWIAIVNDQIVIDMMTQGPEDAMCCATQRTLVDFVLDETQLVATDVAVIGVQALISQTQVITFTPSIIPDVSQAGACATNAHGLGRADAWRCVTDDEQVYDPCFEVDSTPTIVCGADPVTGESGFVVELAEPLPAADPGEQLSPWLVQLADSTLCSLVTDPTITVNDELAPYRCTDEARSHLMEDFEIFEPFWFAHSVVVDETNTGHSIRSSVVTPVATIWR